MFLLKRLILFHHRTLTSQRDDYLFLGLCIRLNTFQVPIVPLKKGNRLYSYHLSRIYCIPQTIQPTTSPCQAHYRPAMTIL